MQADSVIHQDRNIAIQSYSKKELNSFFLEEIFERSLKETKRPLIKRVFSNFVFTTAIVVFIVFGLSSFSSIPIREWVNMLFTAPDGFFNIITGISGAISLISALYIWANKDAHSSEMHKKFKYILNIQEPDDISTLDGILILLETIKESNYADVIKGISLQKLLSIRAKGKIADEEDFIRDTYWLLVKSLIGDISIKNGVLTSGVSVYKTSPQSTTEINRQIQDKQESFIRSFIINNKE